MTKQGRWYATNADKVNDGRKSAYRDRVDAGLCPRCGKEKAEDSRLCEEHRDAYRKFQDELNVARRIVRGMGTKAQHDAYSKAYSKAYTKGVKDEAI